MQINSINKVFTLPLLLAMVAGCANTTPELTLNPEASQNSDPVVGMNGKAADAAIDRYNSSYESPPVTNNVFTIGVGSGGGSSGGGGGGKGM